MTVCNVVFPVGRQILYECNHYSPVAHDGSLLLASGQVGSHNGGSPESELEIQIRHAFDGLNAVLVVAGYGFDDVLSITVFVIDAEANFERIWKVVPEYWGETPHPMLTTVGVNWLYGFSFEIKVAARLPEGRKGRAQIARITLKLSCLATWVVGGQRYPPLFFLRFSCIATFVTYLSIFISGTRLFPTPGFGSVHIRVGRPPTSHSSFLAIDSGRYQLMTQPGGEIFLKVAHDHFLSEMHKRSMGTQHLPKCEFAILLSFHHEFS